MICSKCGEVNNSDSKFCFKCGNQLETQTYESQQLNENQVLFENNISNNVVNSFDNKKQFTPKMLIILVAVAIAGVAIFLGYKLFDKTEASNNIDDINYSNAFFLENKENKYALFNENGKQLTDFIFKSASPFKNETAKVTNEKGEAGIISSNGKMTVQFGKYSVITQSSGLYKVITKDDYNDYLIDGKGNIISDLEKDRYISYIGADLYSIIEKNNTFIVLNYNGKKIISFPSVKDAEDPTTNDEDNYSSVFYNNKEYILNTKTSKELLSFDTNKHYCINEVSEDGKEMILGLCSKWYEKQDDVAYKYIKNGKIVLSVTKDKCSSLYLKDENISCNSSIMDEKGNVLFDTSNKFYIDIDNGSYAKSSGGTFDGVDFYDNDKLVKHVSCRKLEEKEKYTKDGMYLLSTFYSKTCNTKSGSYEYYNAKGEKAIDEIFKKASLFDDQGLAVVSKDGINKYLINTSGKKIGNEYKTITYTYNYYIVSNNTGKGIVNKEGQEVIKCEYSSALIHKVRNKEYAIIKNSNSQNIVYDLTDNKSVATVNGNASLHDNYISVTNDDKAEYYTYYGKKFYEI
jgi:hypothetical protein